MSFFIFRERYLRITVIRTREGRQQPTTGADEVTRGHTVTLSKDIEESFNWKRNQRPANSRTINTGQEKVRRGQTRCLAAVKTDSKGYVVTRNLLLSGCYLMQDYISDVTLNAARERPPGRTSRSSLTTNVLFYRDTIHHTHSATLPTSIFHTFKGRFGSRFRL